MSEKASQPAITTGGIHSSEMPATIIEKRGRAIAALSLFFVNVSRRSYSKFGCTPSTDDRRSRALRTVLATSRRRCARSLFEAVRASPLRVSSLAM